MKTFKKNRKKIIFVIVSFLIVLIISAIIFVVNVRNKNYFFYENNNYTIETTKEDVNNSNLIIINDFVIGAEYENKWISVKDVYTMLDNKKNISIDMYDTSRKLGTYETSNLLYNSNSNILYTTTTRQSQQEDYIAFSSDESGLNRNPFMQETVATAKDIRQIKQALR